MNHWWFEYCSAGLTEIESSADNLEPYSATNPSRLSGNV